MTVAKAMLLSTQSGTAYHFVLPLAKHLRANGFDVALGCSDEPQTDVADYHDAIEREGYRLLRLPIARRVRPLADARALGSLTRVFRQESFDIVHTFNSKAGILGRTAARVAGVPIVIHSNFGLPFFKANNFSVFESLIYLGVELVAARFTDRILTVSKQEFDKARRFLIARPPKLVNLDFGAKLDIFCREAVATEAITERVEKLKRTLSGRQVVGAVARLVPEKGVDCLLDAAALCKREYPELAVVIVGDGPERGELERKSEELGLQENVFFLGALTQATEVAQIFSLLDVFVLPTRWESFGVVFVEAMSMELPVVGPKMEPISTVVGEEAGILVHNNTAAYYGTAILELLSDEAKRTEMGRAGRRRALELWDERRLNERVEGAYRELVELRLHRRVHE